MARDCTRKPFWAAAASAAISGPRAHCAQTPSVEWGHVGLFSHRPWAAVYDVPVCRQQGSVLGPGQSLPVPARAERPARHAASHASRRGRCPGSQELRHKHTGEFGGAWLREACSVPTLSRVCVCVQCLVVSTSPLAHPSRFQSNKGPCPRNAPATQRSASETQRQRAPTLLKSRGRISPHMEEEIRQMGATALAQVVQVCEGSHARSGA